MKSESLHALIIDWHSGELSPEAVELLEHHLATHAAARAEAERIRQSLALTRDVVLHYPELGHVPVLEKALTTAKRPTFSLSGMARAAAVVLLAALAGTGGYLAGRSKSPTADFAETLAVPRKESPWARYRMTLDPSGEGMQVVRVNTQNMEGKSIQ